MIYIKYAVVNHCDPQFHIAMVVFNGLIQREWLEDKTTIMGKAALRVLTGCSHAVSTVAASFYLTEELKQNFIMGRIIGDPCLTQLHYAYRLVEAQRQEGTHRV